MSIKLSVTIITFNEEANIERCINSVQGVADEVIVVDSFSTDTTKEICLGLGVRFLENAFKGMIQQKQFALEQTSHPYVLALDADESLTDTLRESIQKVKQNWRADIYWMNRLTNYRGKWIHHSGWYPDRKVRLFDKRKVEWGGQNPHDRIVPLGKVTEGRLKGDFLHYFNYTFKEHLDQINRYSEIFATEKKAQGKRTSLAAILVKPPFRFFRTYFLQLGFLDGFEGFLIAVLSSYTVFIKYTKLFLLYRDGK